MEGKSISGQMGKFCVTQIKKVPEYGTSQSHYYDNMDAEVSRRKKKKRQIFPDWTLFDSKDNLTRLMLFEI